MSSEGPAAVEVAAGAEAASFSWANYDYKSGHIFRQIKKEGEKGYDRDAAISAIGGHVRSLLNEKCRNRNTMKQTNCGCLQRLVPRPGEAVSTYINPFDVARYLLSWNNASSDEKMRRLSDKIQNAKPAASFPP